MKRNVCFLSSLFLFCIIMSQIRQLVYLFPFYFVGNRNKNSFVFCRLDQKVIFFSPLTLLFLYSNNDEFNILNLLFDLSLKNKNIKWTLSSSFDV